MHKPEDATRDLYTTEEQKYTLVRTTAQLKKSALLAGCCSENAAAGVEVFNEHHGGRHRACGLLLYRGASKFCATGVSSPKNGDCMR